jgi:DNA-binding CsgD family transcriptional regulator
MSQHDRLLNLIRLLYAAPGSQEGWQTFLDGLCTAVNGSAGHFLSVNIPTPRACVSLSVRTDPAVLLDYQNYWGTHDPWGTGIALRRPTAEVVTLGDELISHTQLKKTMYYNDFSRHTDMVRAIIGTIETGPRAISVISINGTERRGPFRSRDSQLLTALMPHLHRGLQLHRRLLTAEGISDNLVSAIHCAKRAILLMSAAGRITFMNHEAERLTAANDGLSVEAGELRAARAEETDRLRVLLADAGATTNGQGIGAGGALALSRPSGRRSLMVLVSPLSKRPAFVFGAELAASMVIVTDPEQPSLPDEEMIRELLDLTPAEARLARALVQGLDLQQAAARLRIGIGTARTRLKVIFEKTDTHGQADLVRLLLTSMPSDF